MSKKEPEFDHKLAVLTWLLGHLRRFYNLFLTAWMLLMTYAIGRVTLAHNDPTCTLDEDPVVNWVALGVVVLLWDAIGRRLLPRKDEE